MRRPLSAIVVLASILALGCASKDPYNPGQAIGVFHVTGKLIANGCVAAGDAPDPWLFDVKLSRDGSTLYWIQGGLPIQGTLDASSHTLMTAGGSQEVRAADPKSKTSGCTLQRDDVLDATLGAAPVTTFRGALQYTFSPTADSDCSDQLAVAGGGWANLPCQVSYTLTGAKTDDKPAY